jgi:hypothetical protein
MLNQIAEKLQPNTITLGVEEETRGQRLHTLLTSICYDLGEAFKLTDGKVDLAYLLSIEGAYLTSLKSGTLPDDVVHPDKLFDDSLFPTLDATKDDTIDVEVIEDEEA